MRRPIGYYVHHQGSGHLHRARMIAGALQRSCTLIGTFADGADDTAVSLPDDRMGSGFEGEDGVSSRPEALHYAPVNHAGVRARMAAIAAWVAANDPALMIVDVSVEVALFVRLLSVPLVLMRLAGRRDDQPHLEAFRAAQALVAPFPAAFEGPTTPAWVKDKTIYAGFLASSDIALVPPSSREIAVVFGRGGKPMEIERLAEAARATPDWRWCIYGDTTGSSPLHPDNLHVHGWTNQIGLALDRAEVVIGGAGDGLLAALVARGKRFICIPEPRAFDEQVEKANVLATANLAVILWNWPAAAEWAEILIRAMALDPERLHAFHSHEALATTAMAIETVCANFKRRDPLESRPS